MYLSVITIVAVGCKDNPGPTAGGGDGPNPPRTVPSEPGVGFGVSGLLFNNNLVLYDRARSDRIAFDLLLIPQMYFTNIEDEEFPVYGSFPRSQIVSGGVKIDDIAALTNPALVSPDEISTLSENSLITGVTIDGESRAYPHNLLWWHEIINDTVNGRQISVTYCPLTSTGLVFDTETPSDRLEMIPSVEVTWGTWNSLHPETKVVAASNSSRPLSVYPYGQYRSDNQDIIFPLNQPLNNRYGAKQMVHGLLIGSAPRAYSFSDMGVQAAVHDKFSGTEILVIYDRNGELALSYDRTLDGQNLTFDIVQEGSPFRLKDRETDSTWTVEGIAVNGPLSGQSLNRIQNAYNAFWFAWSSFWPATSVYSP